MIRNLLFGTTTFVLLAFNCACESDPCDEGYTQITENGASFCIPDYVVGIEKDLEFGSIFYHRKHGVISYENGFWTNQYDEFLTLKQLNNFED